jgi:GMP synthase (glutamine-hydrolysing)
MCWERVLECASVKKFLILLARPEIPVADGEYRAFLQYGNLREEETERVSVVHGEMPRDMTLASYAGIIAGGSPFCSLDPQEEKERTPHRIESDTLLQHIYTAVYANDIPTLSACYIGAITACCGGVMTKDTQYAEAPGYATITLTEEGMKDVLLHGVTSPFTTFLGHKESCATLPPEAVLLAQSEKCPVHMYRVKNNIYVTQFHPELDFANLSLRIDFYKDSGYFPPEDAEHLKEVCRAVRVTEPMRILRNFVERYRAA